MHPRSKVRVLSPTRAQAEISLSAIEANFRIIARQVPFHQLLPMIKADAYGHGAIPIARHLVQTFGPQIYGLGVATLEEGQAIRAQVSRTPIFVFSGAAVWNQDKADFCVRHQLVPVLASLPDVKTFLKKGHARKLRYEIKFNTGMNRLGINLGEISEVRGLLEALPPKLRPTGIASHLALGEDPDHPVSRRQRESLQAIHEVFSPLEGIREFHFANSSAVWNAQAWQLKKISTVSRPGLSLYGVRPWASARPRGLRAAMRLRYQVLRRAQILPGESIGYGATYTPLGKRPESIAILGAGYADGLLRGQHPQGQVYIQGRAFRLLGRISMDMSACLCPSSLATGAWVDFLGGKIDPWTQAQNAGTIPYELLTSVSGRVKRVYD